MWNALRSLFLVLSRCLGKVDCYHYRCLVFNSCLGNVYSWGCRCMCVHVVVVAGVVHLHECEPVFGG